MTPHNIPANSIVTDNFSVYSALRAVAGEDTQRYSWPDRWESVKFSFDLASLATLTELLVLHDKLYVDWATQLWQCEELSNIIVPIAISDRDQLLRQAIIKVETMGEEIRNNRQNFADPRHGHNLVAPHHAVIQQLPLEAVVLDILGDYDGVRDFDYAAAAEFRGGIDHHKIKWAGFLLGAFYYDSLASKLRLPYVPHLSRTHVVAYEMAATAGETDVRQIAKKLISIVQDVRNKSAGEVNEYFGNQIFDVYVPIVFGAVIKKSKTPKDILINALRLRDSSEGRAIRKWMSETLSAIEIGDIAKSRQRIGNLKEISEELMGVQAGEKETQGIQIALGPVTLDPSTGAVGKFINKSTRHRSLRILRFLTSQILTIKNMKNEIERVFGSDMAKALEAYPKQVEVNYYKADVHGIPLKISL